MKCERCGNELRLGNEQVGVDQNQNPVIHQFAYCDNCRMKWDLSMQQQNYNNMQNKSVPIKKSESVCGIIGMILSFLSCSWIFAVPAIILCIMGLCSKNKKSTCGAIGIGFAIIMFLLGILAPTYLQYVEEAKEENGLETIVEEFEDKEIISQEKEEPIIEEEPTIEYMKIDANTLIDDLYNNALKAEKKYQDAYIEVTGKLSVIDSDGVYISLSRTDDEISFLDVMCYIKDDSQLEKVLEMSIDDTVVVKGKVVQIGEILGYSVDIHDLEIVLE